MYQTTWGKVGEKILKKVQKITQMFENLYPQFLLINSLKPLISLNYTNLSTSPHNPKVAGSSPAPATKTVDTVRLQKMKSYSIFKFTSFLPH